MTSKLVDIIRDHVNDYLVSTSMAEGKENEANGFKSLKKKTNAIQYQLREAETFQYLYEGQASMSRRAAHKLYDAFKDDFDSDELREAEELIDKL
ncbi:hypothetical protein J2T20_003282 [Paenibacillus wynnii]|nr:hypothetical protein [Paenibacillus wynnii]